jgi:hypothetical protein
LFTAVKWSSLQREIVNMFKFFLRFTSGYVIYLKSLTADGEFFEFFGDYSQNTIRSS